MGSLEEQLSEVNWWIPGLREFAGILMVLWFVLIAASFAFGLRDLFRLHRAKSRGDIGPQAYRWRSDERGQYTGRLAITGCLLEPLMFLILSLFGYLGVALALSDDTAWNLLVLSSTVFWIFSYRWLYQRWRAGFHEPEPPEFGDDRPGKPIILEISAADRNRS